MKELFAEIDMDRESASFIAAGLRELAGVDGYHALELALIEDLERELGTEPVQFDLTADHPLRSDELKEVFMRSAILLALADGQISELEGERIGRYANLLGIGVERLAELFRDVKVFLLSAFAGAEIFRDQAEQIGHDLGLDEEDIQTTLQ